MLLFSLFLVLVLLCHGLYRNKHRTRSAVALPWFHYGRETATISRMRKIALEVRKRRTFKRVSKYIVIWPVLSCILSLRLTFRNGKYVARQYNVRRWTQFLQMMHLANRYNWSPVSYYEFRMWKEENRRNLHLYFQNFEAVNLMRWLNRGLDTDRIDDKLRFFNFCREMNIPTAPILVAFDSDGGMQWFQDKEDLPRCDLILKPTGESCGRGIEKWAYNPDSGMWSSGQHAFDADALLKYFKKKAAESSLIVQPVLKNHPSINQFSSGGLCTLRVLSVINTDGVPEVLLCSWRMPTGNAFVDNFFAGGLAASLSAEGYLTTAVGRDVRNGEFSNHPDTQASISGQPLPGYEKMIDLALTAHSFANDIQFMAWDVALTENGPMLLEGNTRWCAKVVQVPSSTPLGKTKFVEVFDRIMADAGYEQGIAPGVR